MRLNFHKSALKAAQNKGENVVKDLGGEFYTNPCIICN